jgi:formate dehydrogenase subunit gamma
MARAIRFLLLGLALLLAAPAAAQAPGPVNPRQLSVQEQQLMQQLQQIDGRVSIPNPQAGVLIQPQGRDWRTFNQETLFTIGAVAIVGMAALLTVFYLVRGRVRVSGGYSGRTILRFNGFERFVHWLTASTFIVLAISGLNITFGKSLVLPLVGAQAFTDLSQALKYAHNFLAFPFMAGVVLMFVLWVADNIPNATDANWIAKGGGIVGHAHPPAKRFNAGQKLIFWSVVIGGVVLSISGLLLMFPFQFTDIAGMQLSAVVHGLAGVVMIAIILGHIYIGSLGMEGAFNAMGSGQVDLNWAKEHHSLWVEREMAKGRVPAGSPQAAE